MKNASTLRLFLMSVLFALTAGTAWADDVTDVLTSGSSCFNVSGSTYKAATYTGPSGATYSAQMAGGNDAIQLRSTNSNSGIVTTVSGGKVKSISITWQSATADARTVDIYGSNTAYTSPEDLYSTATQGTKLGSVKKSNGNGTITVSGDYAFIGIRSASGAMYISEIAVVWEQGEASNKEDAGLEFSATTATVDLAEAATFTFPALNNPNSLAVSYSSTDTNVATVDANGNVTLVGKGTTTIKAESEETETYAAGSASYTLTVTNYGHTYWSEDWSGTDALSKYEHSSTGSIYASDSLAGGTPPEFLIRAAETLTYTADVQGHKGALTIEFRSNRNGLAFSTTTNGVTIGSVTANGQLYSQEITLESTVKSVEFVLTNGYNSNARVDDILLYGDYDPDLIVEDTRTATTVAFSEAEGYTTRLDNQDFSVQATVYDESDAPVSGVAVTYTSLNENVAIVNETTGKITPVAIGTATIKATFAGDENYIESNATTTLKVTYPYAHTGSQDDPFTVEEAIAKAKENGTTSNGETYYTTGIISQIDNYNSNYSSIQYWISNDGATTNQLEIYSGKNLDGADFASIDELAVGYTVTVAGELKMYNTTAEYDKGNYIVAIDKHDDIAAPTFSIADGTYTEPQTVTISVEDGLTIVYTTDGENPKTAASATTTSGNTATVTVDATTTIRAIAFDGTNYSIETAATYTIVDPYLVVATYDFTDAEWVENEGYSNSSKVQSWPVGNVVIGGDKDKGSTDPTYYSGNGGNLRTYNNGRFVVASTDGTPITSIVIKCSGSSYTNMTLPENQPGSFVLSGNVYTWTPDAANDVVSVTFSGNGTSRISTLTVTTKSDVTVTENVAISAAGFATFYTEQPIEVPTGMTAGIISAASDPDENGIATLTIDWNYPEGTIVPAATPLIIKGEAGNYTCICKGTTAAVPAGNMLMGSAVATTTTGGDKFFMLSYGKGDKADQLGFFYGAAEGAAFESEAGKCWIAVDAASGIRGFVLDAETLTGISQVNAAANGQTVFDLQGRRVNAPEKGVYIINGKKVMVK